MAGQPPEPSFQPAGQDQSLTQGRPAWQPGAYPPPAPGTGQPGYSAPAYTPADQGYAPPDQGYAPPDQGYASQDQTYTSVPQGQSQAQAQPQGQDYQGYQGYQPPGYGAAPGQQQDQRTAPPQWQGIAGVTSAPPKQPKQPRQHGERGFLGSLFDFSFSTFVTPKIVRVLYILVTIWTALIALIIAITGFKYGGASGGIFTLIVVEPIFVLLTLGVYRVVLEAFMVVFRIYEETKQIRENATRES